VIQLVYNFKRRLKLADILGKGGSLGDIPQN
jgi:hypothetical protein